MPNMGSPTLAERFRNSLQRDGLAATARKCALAPFRQLQAWQQQYRRWRLQRASDPKVIFQMIHRLNVWDDPESVSGPGSTLAYTATIRQHLPVVLRQFAVRTLFDAPCGDFNWMRQVVVANPVDYLGGDIVPELVRANQTAHGGERTRFFTFDLTRDLFPAADLWFCRDCFLHLSYREILAALKNFAASGIPYALLTNDRGRPVFANTDIRTGDCRRLNLCAAPFHLPPDVLYRVPEGPTPDSGREMCLWTREQISAALPGIERTLPAAAVHVR